MRPEVIALFGGLTAAALLSALPVRSSGPTAQATVTVLGHDGLSATLLWAGLGASLISDAPPSDEDVVATVRQIGRLDAEWTIPWAYASLFLEQSRSPRAHDLLVEAAVRFEDRAWFPARLAVMALARGDREDGARWMRTAAARPDAPLWCDAWARALDRP